MLESSPLFNHCRSRINRIKQQQLSLPIYSGSYNGRHLVLQVLQAEQIQLVIWSLKNNSPIRIKQVRRHKIKSRVIFSLNRRQMILWQNGILLWNVIIKLMFIFLVLFTKCLQSVLSKYSYDTTHTCRKLRSLLKPCMHCIDDTHVKELLPLFMTNKGICTKIVDRHITRSKPRAARFAVSTDVRCNCPE